MTTSLRLLIVEDSEDDALLLAHEVRRAGFDLSFTRVDTAEAMRAALRERVWDAILCDYVMPGFSAPAALSLLQGTGLDIPFIVVSGTIGEPVAVAMMKAGAHDYLMKSSLARLGPVIDRELREAEARHERRRVEETLRESEEKYRQLFTTDTDAIVIFDAETRQFMDVNDAALKLYGYTREEFLRLTLTDDVTDEPERAEEPIRRTLREGRHRVGLRRHRKKDGTTFPAEISNSTYRIGDRRVICGIVRDVTERERADRELRMRLAMEKALSHASNCLASGGVAGIDDVLKIFGTVVGVSRGYVFQFRDGDRRFDNTHEWCAEGVTPQIENLHDLDPDASPWWIARLRQGENIMIEDVESLPPEADAEKAILRAQDIRAVLAVPIHGQSRQLLGFIGFDDVDNCRTWSEDTVRLLCVVGQTIGHCLERDRAAQAVKASREQLRALAGRLQEVREEERAQLARHIHDDLGHGLAAMKMDLAWLDRRLGGVTDAREADAVQDRIATLSRGLDEMIQTVRDVASDLRPGLLDDVGPAAALEWLVEEFKRRSGIDSRFAGPPDEPSIDRDVATVLYRICQEALTNVVQHAGATSVQVRLALEPECVSLEIEDNGKGIGPQQIQAPQSLGILGMRERAALLGGEFSIAGRPGTGTTVTATFPLAGGQETTEASERSPLNASTGEALR